jgi:lipopolysaccharide transport system permease protein
MNAMAHAAVRPAAALADVWRYRELLRSLVGRNLKAKYQRSMLGFVWTLLNPMLMLAVLVGVFSYVIRIKIDHYWAFLISGYFVWSFFSQMLNTGTYIMAEHGRLARAVRFPAEVPVLAATLSRLVEFSIEMTIMLLLLAVAHHGHVPASFALLPVLVVLQVLIALGVVLPLAVMSVFLRDIEHALPVVLTAMFYVSPVIYGLDFVPDAVRPLFLLNPMAGLLTLYQSVLYHGQMPSLFMLAYTTVVALLIAPIGYAIFNRYKSVCAEIV